MIARFVCILLVCITSSGFAQEYFGGERAIIPTVIKGPVEVQSSDLYNNGLDDLVILGDSGRAFYAVQNKGGEEFELPRILFDGLAIVNGFVLEDFTDDGFPDLLIHFTGSSVLQLRINDTNGDFGSVSTIELEHGFFGLDAVDLNNDGLLDIVSGCSWRENQGGGTFAPSTIYCLGGGFGSIDSFSDIDQDNDIDLAMASDKLWIGKNDGASTVFLTIFDLPENHEFLSFFDVNADGFPDLLTEKLSETNSDRILYWFENDGTGDFASDAQQIANLGDFNLQGFHIEDLDSDGRDDLVIDNIFNAESIEVRLFLNDCCAPWSSEKILGGSFKDYAFFTGDEVGLPDFALLTSGKLTWAKNEGDGSIDDMNTIGVFGDFFGRSAIGSLDLNPRLDFVRVSRADKELEIYYNVGLNEMTPDLTLDFEDCAFAVEIFDLDHDGKNDIIVGTSSSGFALTGLARLYFIRNENFEGFAPPVIFAEESDGFNILNFQIVDLNNDGFEDIRADNEALYSNGDFIFESSYSRQTLLDIDEGLPFTIYCDDFDSDGDNDLFGTSLIDFFIGVNLTGSGLYRNNGLGQFHLGEDSITAVECLNFGIAPTDFDQDGRKDFLFSGQSLCLVDFFEEDFKLTIIDTAANISVHKHHDLNGDGQLDFLGETSPGRFGCRFADANGAPLYGTDFEIGTLSDKVEFTDFDQDGFFDMVYHKEDGIFYRTVERSLRTPLTSFVVDPCGGTRFVNTTYQYIPDEHLPELEVLWDFGDGQTRNEFHLENEQHEYSETGVYTVSLSVCNDFACDTMIQEIEVSYVPGVSISNSGLVGESVEFSAIAEGYDNFTWVTGDGTISSEKDFSHVYWEPDCYQAEVFLTDSEAVTCTAHLTFDISIAASSEVIGLEFGPTPSKSVVNLSTINSCADIISIDVFNTKGSSVMRLDPNSSQASINVRALPTGTYFARIEFDDGSFQTKNFFVYH